MRTGEVVIICVPSASTEARDSWNSMDTLLGGDMTRNL